MTLSDRRRTSPRPRSRRQNAPTQSHSHTNDKAISLQIFEGYGKFSRQYYRWQVFFFLRLNILCRTRHKHKAAIRMPAWQRSVNSSCFLKHLKLGPPFERPAADTGSRMVVMRRVIPSSRFVPHFRLRNNRSRVYHHIEP